MAGQEDLACEACSRKLGDGRHQRSGHSSGEAPGTREWGQWGEGRKQPQATVSPQPPPSLGHFVLAT